MVFIILSLLAQICYHLALDFHFESYLIEFLPFYHFLSHLK